MTSRERRDQNPTEINSQQGATGAGESPRSYQGDLAALAHDLVDKVGIDGAIRYCRSLGWRGVLDQVEQLRHSH